MTLAESILRAAARKAPTNAKKGSLAEYRNMPVAGICYRRDVGCHKARYFVTFSRNYARAHIGSFSNYVSACKALAAWLNVSLHILDGYSADDIPANEHGSMDGLICATVHGPNGCNFDEWVKGEMQVKRNAWLAKVHANADRMKRTNQAVAHELDFQILYQSYLLNLDADQC